MHVDANSQPSYRAGPIRSNARPVAGPSLGTQIDVVEDLWSGHVSGWFAKGFPEPHDVRTNGPGSELITPDASITTRGSVFAI